MSFFLETCPGCGVQYYTGVVGTTLMGVHTCETAEQREKAERAILAGWKDVKAPEAAERKP